MFYEKNLDGLWQEICFADGCLKEYRISPKGEFSFEGDTISLLLDKTKVSFFNKLDEEEIRREKIQIKIEEERKLTQTLLEAERKREKQRHEEKRLVNETHSSVVKNSKEIQEADFEQNEFQVRDCSGNRWVKCDYCGKIKPDTEFSSYGGLGHMNKGTCKECSDRNPLAKQQYNLQENLLEKKYDPTICPRCGKQLVEKNGKNGRFIGCSGFPKCRYSRSIR